MQPKDSPVKCNGTLVPGSWINKGSVDVLNPEIFQLVMDWQLPEEEPITFRRIAGSQMSYIGSDGTTWECRR